MKFDCVEIKNFRNFEDIKIDLANKNIFFGLNDVGKTNFLFALRYVFDKDIRKQGLIDSDFHDKQTQNPVEVIVTMIAMKWRCTQLAAGFPMPSLMTMVLLMKR